MEQSKLLGEILVDKGLLTPLTVERLVVLASRLGKRLGVVLEEMGLVTEEELAVALASQFNLRKVANFAAASFAPEVLATVSAAVALDHLLFPLRLEGNRLALAMADPSNMRIVDNLSANSGLTVTRLVATGTEIKAAICRHYLGRESRHPGSKTVLVVEDDKSVRELLEEVLSRDYQVITAVDGLDAYREVIARKPQVVLTDKEMPKLSGFALLGALRSSAETKRIPAILITGSEGEKAESEAFSKGFFDFIRKPINEASLLNRVNRAYEFSQNQNYLFLK